jgi:hypothetical protein
MPNPHCKDFPDQQAGIQVYLGCLETIAVAADDALAPVELMH